MGLAVLFSAGQALAGKDHKARLAGDEWVFYSRLGRRTRDPGSPVGPPERVTICHKGRTISVAAPAVPGHLAHGDSLGPCPTTGTTPSGSSSLDMSRLPSFFKR